MIKTLNSLEIERNFLDLLKGIFKNVQIISCLMEKDWMLFRNKTRILTLTISIQHCTGNPSQRNQPIKRINIIQIG